MKILFKKGKKKSKDSSLHQRQNKAKLMQSPAAKRLRHKTTEQVLICISCTSCIKSIGDMNPRIYSVSFLLNMQAADRGTFFFAFFSFEKILMRRCNPKFFLLTIKTKHHESLHRKTG
jgi:hypothetical protein